MVGANEMDAEKDMSMKRLIWIMLFVVPMAYGADFDKGLACYTAKDYTCALAEFLALAEQGDASAQFNLGVLYSNGKGVRQDYFKAVKWYRKAAEQGLASAQYNLGLMYANGQGIRQDKSTAKQWFGKACDNKNQLGCKNYKILNEQGID